MTYRINDDHWLEGIEHKKTNKYTGGKKIKPIVIVYHFTCGWTTEGDLATLTGPDKAVSCQFLVGRDGKAYQMVACNRRAWHAGPSMWEGINDINSESIGIEISNIGWLRKVNDATYEDYYGNIINADGSFRNSRRKAASAPRDWFLTEKYPRLKPGQYVWEPYYKPQLAELDLITSALVEKYPTIRGGVTHQEIDKRKWKVDPGPAFPLERYKTIIANGGEIPIDIPVVAAPDPKTSWGDKIKKAMRWPL